MRKSYFPVRKDFGDFHFGNQISFRFQLGGGDLSAGGLSLRGSRPEKEAEAKAAKAKSGKKRMIPEIRKKSFPEKNMPIFFFVN